MVGRVADRNVQVYGGNGYVREYCAEQLFRDARLFIIYKKMTQFNKSLLLKYGERRQRKNWFMIYRRGLER
ncbi:MAG: hypothetical protein COA59_13620 [Colwellia sp.]|nr:MAG: hypothetical protein COA59_13620 [Colwellia sp.]